MFFRLFLLVNMLSLVWGYKIFVYNPKWGTSHVNFMGKLADTLVRAGHDVTQYTPIVIEECTTNGTKLAKIVIRELDFPTLPIGGTAMQAKLWTGELEGFTKMQEMFTNVRTTFGNLCEKQLNDLKLMDAFEAEKFDIALGESFDLCYYGLMRRIGVKNYITVSSSGVFENSASAMGVPTTPSFVPSIISSYKTPFSYFERVVNLAQDIMMNTQMNKNFGGDSIKIMKKMFGEDFDVDREMSNSAYYFTNVDEHVDFPRPISHKMIYIGGLGKVQAKPLEKNFEDIMQKSKKGVVYVSFGTVSLSYMMPQEIKSIFLETFKKFPDVTFLWKYEKDEHRIAEGIPNVVTSKWVPQNDLLEHPKLLAFVSHGGMNSVQEGASKGVPMVMIPLFADQPRNSKMLEFRNMAITLDRKSLSVEKLSNAIKTIIEDDTYRKNAKRISSIISGKPMSAEERVVKYAEFAAKFGPDLNLVMEGRNMNFVEFYCLDIIVPAILLIVLVLYLAYRLMRSTLGKLLGLLATSNKLKGE